MSEEKQSIFEPWKTAPPCRHEIVNVTRAPDTPDRVWCADCGAELPPDAIENRNRSAVPDTIPPALTSDEWKHGQCVVGDTIVTAYAEPPVLSISDGRDGVVVGVAKLHAIIALANDTLPRGATYKITRDDVTKLGEAAETMEREWGWDDDEATFLRSLAAKLAALLPPE